MSREHFNISRCPCGDKNCKDWHVNPVAAVQGVNFTRPQAVAVACLLNSGIGNETPGAGYLKPVCVKCQRFYRVQKNGYFFVEGMPIGSGTPAGTSKPELWKPYKLWVGDLWACLGCGHQLVLGAINPIGEHFQPDFKAKVEEFGANQLQVNDC